MVKILVRPLVPHSLMQVCYCLSYTRTSEIPARARVTVSVLPSFERTCRLELMTLPPFHIRPHARVGVYTLQGSHVSARIANDWIKRAIILERVLEVYLSTFCVHNVCYGPNPVSSIGLISVRVALWWRAGTERRFLDIELPGPP